MRFAKGHLIATSYAWFRKFSPQSLGQLCVPGIVEFFKLGRFLVGKVGCLADIFGKVVQLRLWVGASLDKLPVTATYRMLVVKSPVERVVWQAGVPAGQIGQQVDAIEFPVA